MLHLKSIPIDEVEVRVLDTGLLYLINRAILHRVGLVLVLVGEDHDHTTHVEIMENSTGESICFDPALEAECQAKLADFMSDSGGSFDPRLREVIDLIFAQNRR